MKFKLGTCPCSWGVWFPEDDKQIPSRRFLDEAAEVGYRWVELGPYGYLPKEMSQLKRELDRRGLKVSGSFLMPHLEERDIWPELESMVHEVGRRLHDLGAGYLILIDDLYTDPITGKRKREERLDSDAWNRLLDNTHKVARTAREHYGLKTVFHPHAETHVEYAEQVEDFLAQTDPAEVSLCLDTGHFAYRGGDPVDLLSRHAERIAYVHLKSVDADVRRQVLADRIPFASAVGMGVFCEPAQGTLDMNSFFDVLAKVAFDGFVVVEQDMYGTAFDRPLQIARRTFRYIQERLASSGNE